MNVVGFIFARGGSRGIKNKNLLNFDKTTLLGHAISQAKKSKYIKKVFVSTDSKKIAAEAKIHKAEIPFLRPKYLAKNNSPEILSWRHAIIFLKEKLNIKPQYIVSLPTTSPLRKVSDIDKCIQKAIKKKLDIVFCVSKSQKNPFFNILIKKNNKLQIFNNKKNITRRQDAPQCFDMTTVCYVFKPEYIMKNLNFLRGNTGFIEVPKERSIDIDTYFEYKLAKLIKKYKY
jgi:CMP-N-acetylneuraminic acid synthetase